MSKKTNPENRKYAAISKYVILTFIVCFIIYKIFNNWDATTSVISHILSVLAPFILAVILAYFLNPFVNFFQRILFSKKFKENHTRLPRVISIAITYIIFLAAIAIILVFLIPTLVDTVKSLVDQSEQLFSNIEGTVNSFFPKGSSAIGDKIGGYITEKLPDIWDKAGNLIETLLPEIIEIGKTVVSGVINIILALIISVYILWGKGRLRRTLRNFFSAILPDRIVPSFLDICSNSNRVFSRYLVGKTIDSVIIGIICFVSMNIIGACGVEGFNSLSILISVIVGVTNMIPYFGPVIGAIPGILLMLVIAPQSALVFLILIFAIQQFDGNILGPKILGDSTGLQPIWVIFGVIVGGAVAGVAGMFLGVPVVAVIGYLLNTLAEYSKKRKAEIKAKKEVEEAAENAPEAPSEEAAVPQIEEKPEEKPEDKTEE